MAPAPANSSSKFAGSSGSGFLLCRLRIVGANYGSQPVHKACDSVPTAAQMQTHGSGPKVVLCSFFRNSPREHIELNIFEYILTTDGPINHD